MNIIDTLKQNYTEVSQLWADYKSKLVAFRSEAKNDIASLEASARKAAEATQRMNKAYGDVIAMMNGPEMRSAVENAERLAAAMTALANLQSHRLTVAVVDNERT